MHRILAAWKETAICIVNAICQRDTVELRLVCERMLRFNNRRKFKTFKAEKGESWSWDAGQEAENQQTLSCAESKGKLLPLLQLLLRLLKLSSSTRTQWDSSLQRTYGGHLADATIQTSKGKTFSRAYREQTCPTGMSSNFPCYVFSSLEGDESNYCHRSKVKALWY